VTTLIAEGPCTSSHAVDRQDQAADAGCRIIRLVRNHSFDLLLVGFVQNRIGIELALALGSLRSQDVALERVTALDLARTCLLEALGRSAMSLKLWHSDSSITTYNARNGPARSGSFGASGPRPVIGR